MEKENTFSSLSWWGRFFQRSIMTWNRSFCLPVFFRTRDLYTLRIFCLWAIRKTEVLHIAGHPQFYSYWVQPPLGSPWEILIRAQPWNYCMYIIYSVFWWNPFINDSEEVLFNYYAICNSGSFYFWVYRRNPTGTL